MEFSFPPYRREFISIPNVDQWGYCRFFSTDTGVRDILDSEVNEYYGVDPCGHCPIEDDTVEVTVSEVSSLLTAAEMESLRENVNPLALSSECGIDLFIRTACFVTEKIAGH